MTAKREHPFSNGSQFMAWNARNCDRCSKVTYDADGTPSSACRIWRAITTSACDDGSMTAEMARRLGYRSEKPLAYTWDCPERNQDRTPDEWEALEREAIASGLITAPIADPAQGNGGGGVIVMPANATGIRVGYVLAKPGATPVESESP